MKLKAELMDEAAIGRTLMRMAHEICEKIRALKICALWEYGVGASLWQK